MELKSAFLSASLWEELKILAKRAEVHCGREVRSPNSQTWQVIGASHVSVLQIYWVV